MDKSRQCILIVTKITKDNLGQSLYERRQQLLQHLLQNLLQLFCNCH